MSYENDPWCLETATISGALLGEAGGPRKANYSCGQANNGTFRRLYLLQEWIVACEQAATPVIILLTLLVQQVVRGGWISDE